MKTLFLLLFILPLYLGKNRYDPQCNQSMRNGCNDVFNPVCANNARTYANVCELCAKSYRLADEGFENLTIAYPGECAGDSPLSDDSQFHPDAVHDRAINRNMGALP